MINEMLKDLETFLNINHKQSKLVNYRGYKYKLQDLLVEIAIDSVIGRQFLIDAIKCYMSNDWMWSDDDGGIYIKD
jgi:hypothetical protein